VRRWFTASGRRHEIFVAHASNAELWDVEGRRYIVFAGGIAVLNTGHCHPQIIEAVKSQLELYTHTCFQVVAYEPYVALAVLDVFEQEKLLQRCQAMGGLGAMLAIEMFENGDTAARQPNSPAVWWPRRCSVVSYCCPAEPTAT